MEISASLNLYLCGSAVCSAPEISGASRHRRQSTVIRERHSRTNDALRAIGFVNRLWHARDLGAWTRVGGLSEGLRAKVCVC